MNQSKIPSKDPESLVVTRPVETSPQRWEGHMSDDVAATFGPEPMAFLSATPDEIVLSGNRGTYQIPRAAVAKIGRGKMYPWFFSGVRIHHTIQRYPKELQFKPLGLHWRDVLRALREHGYPSA